MNLLFTVIKMDLLCHGNIYLLSVRVEGTYLLQETYCLATIEEIQNL